MLRLVFCGIIYCFAVNAFADQSLTTLSAALDGLEDANLSACITDLVASNGIDEISGVTAIKCHSQGIKGVKGLDRFTHLVSISLHNNKIRTFDPSSFVNLQTLNLTKNQLRSFECSGLNELKEIYIIGNKLERLSLVNLPSLELFKVNRNQLVAFTFSGLSSLERAYLFDNKLEDTSLHRLPSLAYLDVRQNPMPDELYEAMDAIANVTILHDGNAEDWQ